MHKTKREILANLFNELLTQLENSNDLDNFINSIEKVLIESVISFSSGDLGFAADILGVKQKGLESKISKIFGSKDIVTLHVLLKKMRIKHGK